MGPQSSRDFSLRDTSGEFLQNPIYGNADVGASKENSSSPSNLPSRLSGPLKGLSKMSSNTLHIGAIHKFTAMPTALKDISVKKVFSDAASKLNELVGKNNMKKADHQHEVDEEGVDDAEVTTQKKRGTQPLSRVERKPIENMAPIQDGMSAESIHDYTDKDYTFMKLGESFTGALLRLKEEIKNSNSPEEINKKNLQIFTLEQRLKSDALKAREEYKKSHPSPSE